MKSFLYRGLQLRQSSPTPILKPFSYLSFSISKTQPINPHISPPHFSHASKTLPFKLSHPIIVHYFRSPNTCSATHIVDRQDAAHKVFDDTPQPNLKSLCNDPFSNFTRMHSLGLDPSQFDYGNLLSACVLSQSLEFGRQICSLALKNGFYSNGYVVTGLIDLFAKSGRFVDALRVFEENCGGNVVCWNAIIAGGVRNGENFVALDLFRRMVHGFCNPNRFTFSSVLSACAASGERDIGRAIHSWVVKCDVGDDIFVGTCIVDFYAKCGDMDDAVKEFSQMPSRNVVSWTAIISGFVQKEDGCNAVNFLKEMIHSGVEVNKYTLTSVLLACSKCFLVKETMQIHCLTLKNGLRMDC